jgi:hypothetical protein
MGYDRPLDFVFCTVFNKADMVLYSNLDDDAAGTDTQDILYFKPILDRLGIDIPAIIFAAVSADQSAKVGNLTRTYNL